MTTEAAIFAAVCAFASGCFCGAATLYWWVTRPLRAERRQQERDAHDARAFGN